MFETTILALLQGIAEFLPISSSGHLVLGKALLGINEPGIRLDIFLHVGTLLSVCVFYFAVIRRIICRLEWQYAVKVILSAIPAGIVGVLFKDRLEELFASPSAVGISLLFTGVVLLAVKFAPRGDKTVSIWQSLVIGVAQAIAILPGVSRSGMTITTARWLKVSSENAAEFSFLMSIPPIAGAALLEILKAAKQGEAVAATSEPSWAMVAYGGALAGVAGWFALKFLLKALKSDRFWLFGPYCLLTGLLTLILV